MLYRAPYATEWSEIDLETAMDMITDRVIAARNEAWQDEDANGRLRSPHDRHRRASAVPRSTTKRTTSSRSCSRRLGAIQIENQAHMQDSATVPGWDSFGASAARSSGACSSVTSRSRATAAP